MRQARRKGNALVEFSLAVPLLVSLFLGTWQYGYAYYVYNELQEGVRAGARYASLLSYNPSQLSAYQAAVQNVVIYGDPNPGQGAAPIINGLTTANVVVTPVPSASRPDTVTVNVHDFGIGTFWTITLPDKPSTQFTYVGVYTGP